METFKQCKSCKHFENFIQPTLKENCKISLDRNDISIINLASLGFKCPWFEDKEIKRGENMVKIKFI
jgi:hypothetical protein